MAVRHGREAHSSLQNLMPLCAAMHQVVAWVQEEGHARCPVPAECEQCLSSQAPCVGSL